MFLLLLLLLLFYQTRTATKERECLSDLRRRRRVWRARGEDGIDSAVECNNSERARKRNEVKQGNEWLEVVNDDDLAKDRAW